QFVGVEDTRQVALLLLAAPMDQGRAEQIEGTRSRQYRRADAGVLFVKYDLLRETRTAAAIFLRPGDPDPAGGVHRLLPTDALFQGLEIGGDALVGRVVDANLRRQIGVEPAAELATECRMLRAVGKIHDRDPPGDRLRRGY